MRKRVITALAMSVLALSLTGCQKSTPKPGSIAGYDKGEQYLSIWVHSIEDTDEGPDAIGKQLMHLTRSMMEHILRILSLFREMTVAEDTLIRSMHPSCRETFRMC